MVACVNLGQISHFERKKKDKLVWSDVSCIVIRIFWRMTYTTPTLSVRYNLCNVITDIEQHTPSIHLWFDNVSLNTKET